MPSDSRVIWSPLVGGLYATSLDYRSRTWTNTAGYSGQGGDNLPVNSYTDWQCKADSNVASSTRRNKSTGVVTTTLKGWNPDLSYFRELGSTLVSHRSDASFSNELQLRCLSKVADAKTNLRVMFAERQKTCDFILSTANRIYEAGRNFRRGRFRKAAEILGVSKGGLPRSLLEFKYAVVPLLMDVKNSAEFFAQRVVGRPLRFSVHSRLSEDLVVNLAQAGLNRMGFDTNLEKLTYAVSSKKTCRVKLWCEITNPRLSELQQLGLTNPALVAWELTPFSFVFDWLLGVGQWLEGLTALHGVTVRKAMFSSSRVLDTAAIETFPGYSGVFDVYGSWTIYRHAHTRSYSRSPITVSPWGLRPVLSEDLSFERFMTGLALISVNARNLRI